MSFANVQPILLPPQKRELGESVLNHLYNQWRWEWSYLRRKCQSYELEGFYEVYAQRIRTSQLTVFLIIMFIIILVHILLLITTVRDKQNIYVDISIYFISLVLSSIVLSFNFNSELVQRHPASMYITTWIAVTILVLSDLGVTVYHEKHNHNPLMAMYSAFIVFSIYLFLPLPKDIHALLLGFMVTVAYMLDFVYVAYRLKVPNGEDYDWQRLFTEAIFLVCANCIGLFARLTQEIIIRTTFLDRRLCVEETLLLRYARDQEKNLLLSMIPARIVSKIENDVKMRIENSKREKAQRKTILEVRHMNLFIEPHNNVSILYADLVNYTYLTTQLDVRTLVETLHDLFVNFDNDSQRLNVLRIKFLGDCYVCAAGVPVANEYHAKSCVELGLFMIKDIRNVREKRLLDIDMRIGVHSGNILSGVIGAYKWQYDIWSKDVDIANRLEATGVAGRVHVSEQTLRLLDGEYLYEEGTEAARSDRVLRKYQIRSFLIAPRDIVTPSGSTVLTATSRNIEDIEAVRSEYVKVNFMQSTVMQYNQILTQANKEMALEMERMPINRMLFTKYLMSRSRRMTREEMEETAFRSNIACFFLNFKDWKSELAFMKEPDVMFKFSLIFGLFVFVALIMLQRVNSSQGWVFSTAVGIQLFLLCCSIALAWYKKFWLIAHRKKDRLRPTNRTSLFFFELSEIVQTNLYVRIIIYLLLILSYMMSALLQMTRCDRLQVENEQTEAQLFSEGVYPLLCFSPWAITESLILIFAMIFVFTRTPFVLKLCLSILILMFYAMIVGFQFDYIYERSISSNEGFLAEYSHIIKLATIIIIFHAIDRQFEFISKVDYTWKKQLEKRQNDARITNETIKVLVHNILPAHVADIYLKKQKRNELYYEEYDNVAVMFATVINYDTEKVGLRVLNEIVCDFDEVLNSYKGPLKIEKIKVAGWTYMAACGLDVTRRSDGVKTQNLMPSRSSLSESDASHSFVTADESAPEIRRTKSSVHSTVRHDTLQSERFQTSVDDGDSDSDIEIDANDVESRQKNVVYVMAQFALDLMRTMKAFNDENLSVDNETKNRGSLRIGISHGEVMAGVVGSYKPHYDIWGNAVNMASRMDSTGQANSIQVTQKTAKVLKAFGISCYYRGMTFVKGRGKIPTYFIGIDNRLDFQRGTLLSMAPSQDSYAFWAD